MNHVALIAKKVEFIGRFFLMVARFGNGKRLLAFVGTLLILGGAVIAAYQTSRALEDSLGGGKMTGPFLGELSSVTL